MAKTKKEESRHLSDFITHFRYYTKRKNRYFFTAWINFRYTHITVTILNNLLDLEFTPSQPSITPKQWNMIAEACREELTQRKFI
jgi:hypothetical protein